MSDPLFEDERDGEWWMDLEPYPGPVISLSITQIMKALNKDLKKTYKYYIEFKRAFDEIPPVTGPKLRGLEIRLDTLPRPLPKPGSIKPNLGRRDFRPRY